MSRRASMRLNDALDRWVPPALRDSWIFARAARSMYGDLPIPIDERRSVRSRSRPTSTATSTGACRHGSSRATPTSHPRRSTRWLRRSSESVLDVACGKGYLAAVLASDHRVVGVDVALATGDRAIRHRGAILCEANIEQLPFHDDSFDTVVSTHTLEHVQHLGARRRAPPRRRQASRRGRAAATPYRVTFNPHIHFFPYESRSSRGRAPTVPTGASSGGDWLYVEEQTG